MTNAFGHSGGRVIKANDLCLKINKTYQHIFNKTNEI